MADYRTSPVKRNSTTTNPSAIDDISSQYEVGSVWTNTATGQTFKCVDNTLTAAVWELDSDKFAEKQAVYAAADDQITDTAAGAFQAFANAKVIPIGTLEAGDKIKVYHKSLMVARNAADSHDVALYLGDVATGTLIVQTGDLALDPADYVIFDGEIRIDSPSAGPGAGSCEVDILCKKMVGGVQTESRFVESDFALHDTDAIASDLTIAVDPDAQSVDNQIDQRVLEVEIDRAGVTVL